MSKDIEPISILIAEDDNDYIILVKEALSELKYDGSVKAFSNGEELINFLRTERIGEAGQAGRVLIILDLNMPKKDGHETLKEIRANSALRRLPVVVMTISTDPKEVARCYSEGANSFITKPYDFDQLLSTFTVFKEYWFEKVKIPLS